MSDGERRGRLRGNDDAVWHARIISTMAAAEAERELLRRPAHLIGDQDDRYRIEIMAEQLCQSPPWERLEPRLRAMTRMLVRRHRRPIARVAKVLLEQTTLTGGELDRLVGRSVDDVKPNHAGRYLLAMAAGAGA